MSDHGTSTHTFSADELEQFKSEDFSAGKAVVVLMLGIFGTGVVLYSVVAYWVMNFSNM